MKSNNLFLIYMLLMPFEYYLSGTYFISIIGIFYILSSFYEGGVNSIGFISVLLFLSYDLLNIGYYDVSLYSLNIEFYLMILFLSRREFKIAPRMLRISFLIFLSEYVLLFIFNYDLTARVTFNGLNSNIVALFGLFIFALCDDIFEERFALLVKVVVSFIIMSTLSKSAFILLMAGWIFKSHVFVIRRFILFALALFLLTQYTDISFFIEGLSRRLEKQELTTGRLELWLLGLESTNFFGIGKGGWCNITTSLFGYCPGIHSGLVEGIVWYGVLSIPIFYMFWKKIKLVFSFHSFLSLIFIFAFLKDGKGLAHVSLVVLINFVIAYYEGALLVRK